MQRHVKITPLYGCICKASAYEISHPTNVPSRTPFPLRALAGAKKKNNKKKYSRPSPLSQRPPPTPSRNPNNSHLSRNLPIKRGHHVSPDTAQMGNPLLRSTPLCSISAHPCPDTPNHRSRENPISSSLPSTQPSRPIEKSGFEVSILPSNPPLPSPGSKGFA